LVGGGGDSGEGEKMNLNEPFSSSFLVLEKKNEKQLHVEKRLKRDGQKAHV
jgi:hypothetical protein